VELGKNEVISLTSNLNLERIEFYTYNNKKAITIGVEDLESYLRIIASTSQGLTDMKKIKALSCCAILKDRPSLMPQL
jgi:hypothetical protein